MVRTPHPEENPELYADVGTPDRVLTRRCACDVRARVQEQGRTNRRTPARRHRTIARHHLVPFTSMRCRRMLYGLPPPPRLRNPARRAALQSRQHPGILSQLLRQQPSAATAARRLAGKQNRGRPREQADAHADAERKQAQAHDRRAPGQHLRKDTNFCFF